ncbi:hypothetical protein B0T16DRAFT_397153 [Cercophora newfieldiana]|uniref:DUF7924 domain-containing protein n=1 Tax=Cercophora newfieldiana TaxID=92897 RepID=A0AA40D077_9PEZI|nr:hypothetical protein B0T16DRAFT_397153 [Cercophora newfieldiana]
MGKKGTSKAPPSASKPSNGPPGKSSGTTRTLSTTAPGFTIQARKNGILTPSRSKPPPDFEDVCEELARSHATASPPESEYRRYIDNVEGAPNEATMVVEVSRRLLKEYDDEGYAQVFNQAFAGYPEDVGFNKRLSTPQPDFVEGLRMTEYDLFPVDKYISGAVLNKDNPDSLTLPHLAGECKGYGKSMKEARMQAAYDGAALVHARNQALSYMGKSDPSSITTFTTDGTTLNLFAHHATLSKKGTLEYHQYPIKSINLVNSYEGYKEGRRLLRNAQDRAREQSYALRDQLKEYYEQQEEVPPLPVPEDEGDEVVEH